MTKTLILDEQKILDSINKIARQIIANNPLVEEVVLVGIPRDDRVTYPASVARRKGLTILMSRRMKHVYPRAIALIERRVVDVRTVVSHRFPLAEAAQAFELVASLQDGVVKAMVEL